VVLVGDAAVRSGALTDAGLDEEIPNLNRSSPEQINGVYSEFDQHVG
jgi:hypothetical protein